MSYIIQTVILGLLCSSFACFSPVLFSKNYQLLKKTIKKKSKKHVKNNDEEVNTDASSNPRPPPEILDNESYYYENNDESNKLPDYFSLLCSVVSEKVI